MNFDMNNTVIGFNTTNSDKYADTKQDNMQHMDYITHEGRLKILNQIKELEERKPEISERLSAARLQGSLEENEELHMALEDMQRLDMEITRISEQLSNVKILEPLKPGIYDEVEIGTTVTIENMDTETKHTWTILGEAESDPSNGIISYKSPLGKELLSQTVGDEIEILAGKNHVYYEVLEIKVP